MSAHNIPFSNIKLEKHSKLSQICSYGILSKGLKNEFETTPVNEPSVFKPLKFYCIFKCQISLIGEKILRDAPPPFFFHTRGKKYTFTKKITILVTF